MRTIAFYISNHGFGHASRNIPLIKGLLELDKDLRIIVKTGSNQLSFIKQSLKENLSKIALYEDNTDIGLIFKQNSLDIDKKTLEKVLLRFIATWELRERKEAIFLENNNVDLVISDIVPWIFKSCDKVNIKSVFISNFTWVEIYREYFSKEIYSKYLECYKLADKALLYGLYNNEIKEYFKNVEETGICCRKFNIEKVEDIRNSLKQPKVFVSVGRSINLQEEIDVSNLPYNFICTEGIKFKGKNVKYLPIDIENTQDYIKACDYVITKAGWGTVAEAICAEKPMLIISRGFIAEDRNTAKIVRNLGLGISLRYNKLNSKNLVGLIAKLDTLRNNYFSIDKKYKNCRLDICKKILNCL